MFGEFEKISRWFLQSFSNNFISLLTDFQELEYLNKIWVTQFTNKSIKIIERQSGILLSLKSTYRQDFLHLPSSSSSIECRDSPNWFAISTCPSRSKPQTKVGRCLKSVSQLIVQLTHESNFENILKIASSDLWTFKLTPELGKLFAGTFPSQQNLNC